MMQQRPRFRPLALSFPLALALALTTPARAAFDDCLAGLRAAAGARGVSGATFDSATRGLSPDMEVVAKLDEQPEFKTPIWDYVAGLVDDERVTDGRARLKEHARTFQAAESRFGVDPATIAAVWGVESNFGQNFGKRPIVQSLATLSCFGRRQAYFRTEFFDALKILQNGDVDAAQFNGSWAGAFGHTQFMPSTFLRTAVDMDGDGRRDIIGSAADAIGSTANFLRKAGWTTGAKWGFEVELPAGYAGPSGRTHKQPMSAWSARGIKRIGGGGLGEGTAGLLLPAGPRGPAFLVTRNFDAIYGYNAAESYALAIAVLSDRLRGGRGIQTPWPTDDPPLSRAERRQVQELLIVKGYDIGNPDGVLGSKSRQAITAYQSRAGLTPDGRAGGKVLSSLKAGR